MNRAPQTVGHNGNCGTPITYTLWKSQEKIDRKEHKEYLKK